MSSPSLHLYMFAVRYKRERERETYAQLVEIIEERVLLLSSSFLQYYMRFHLLKMKFFLSWFSSFIELRLLLRVKGETDTVPLPIGKQFRRASWKITDSSWYVSDSFLKWDLNDSKAPFRHKKKLLRSFSFWISGQDIVNKANYLKNKWSSHFRIRMYGGLRGSPRPRGIEAFLAFSWCPTMYLSPENMNPFK